MADGGPAADDLEQLESARTRMTRLTDRARARSLADDPTPPRRAGRTRSPGGPRKPHWAPGALGGQRPHGVRQRVRVPVQRRVVDVGRRVARGVVAAVEGLAGGAARLAAWAAVLM